MKPPARIARLLAIGLSLAGMGFAVGFGIHLRRVIPIYDPDHIERWVEPGIATLVLLLFAMLLRMGASFCELVWLERTWSNLPEELRKVGPLEKVDSGLVIVLSFVPGLAWLWKLGLALAVCNAFEELRKRTPFAARIPKALGVSSVVVSWVPGLNVYLAPFLWELYAIKIDLASNELRALAPKH